MQNPKTNEILNEVIAVIPKGTRAYIVGGAARNAVYYRIFGKAMPQRDYDLLLMGNMGQFVKNLRKLKFTCGLRRKNYMVLKKKKISKPKHHSDYIILDIHTPKEKNIIKNLKEEANFTVNCFAISLRDITSKNWYKKLIYLPEAMVDLKAKRLHVNIVHKHPANLFACLRFMSKGFEAPSKEEVKTLLWILGGLQKWRYKRNVKKIFDYVGGEKKARQLAKKLGIKADIFDFEIIKNLRNKKQ